MDKAATDKAATDKADIDKAAIDKVDIDKVAMGKANMDSRRGGYAEGAGEGADTVTLPVHSLKEAGQPSRRQFSPDERQYYLHLMEAIIFASTETASLALLARSLDLHRADVRQLLDQLVDDYSERNGGIQLREIAGGYQFVTSERYAPAMRQLYRAQKRVMLSRSMMETLAIISYRQPITIPEIESIRGMNSRAMIANLLRRRLIKSQGHRAVPGRPALYRTSEQFLRHFALGSLSDLPTLSELKEIKFDDME